MLVFGFGGMLSQLAQLTKIRSAWRALCQIELIELFNVAFRTIGLGKRVRISYNNFYAINSVEEQKCCDSVREGVDYPYKLTLETDAGIIPGLLECMEGGTGYEHLTPEQITDKFARLLRGGSCVCVIRNEEKIAGFFWLTRGIYEVPCSNRKIIVQLEDDMTVIEFIFIKQSYRRAQVYSRTLDVIQNKYPTERFMCVINRFNEASKKAHEKMGFFSPGKVLYLCFFKEVFAYFRFGKTRRLLAFFTGDVSKPIRIYFPTPGTER